jgi:hypothetical protein
MCEIGYKIEDAPNPGSLLPPISKICIEDFFFDIEEKNLDIDARHDIQFPGHLIPPISKVPSISATNLYDIVISR